MQLASGQMDPMQIVNLIETFGKDSETLTKVMNIVTKFGGAFANQTMSVVNLFQDKNGNPLKEQQTKFIADISNKTSAEAEKYLKLFADISKVGNVMDIEVALTYYSNNPIEAARIQSIIDNINEQKGKIDLDIATKILGAKEMEALRKDQEYFSKLPAEQQKVYLQTLTTMANIKGNNAEAIQNWLKQNPGKTEADYYVESAQKVTKISQDNTIPKGNGSTLEGNRDTTLDSILTDLKRTRDSRINAEGGDAELMRILGGNKDLTIFKGLNQQLSTITGNTDFIDWVGGIEKAIQGKLIKVSNDGAVALTKLGEAARKAYDEKTIGIFQARQIGLTKTADDQKQAFIKLTKAGIDNATALEMVADANLAAAIASKSAGKDAIQAAKDFETANKKNQETARFINPIQSFRDDMSKVSEMLDVQESQARARYEPEIKRINGLIKANEDAIDAKRRYIEIEYDRPIQALQDQTKKLNHDLSLIEKSAELITKKYEEQKEALQKVYELNSRLVQQEKSKISLADALSSGDISQAAQIAQDIRAQNQQYAQEDSLHALQVAQENQIAALRSASGLSRVQIEEKMYNISLQIYAIEEQQQIKINEIIALEDQNYQLKVNQLAVLESSLKKEIDAIDAQRQRFAQAELAIRAAEVQTDSYTEALKRAEQVLIRMVALAAKLAGGGTLDDVEDTVRGGTPTGLDGTQKGIAARLTSGIQNLVKKGNYNAAESATVKMMKEIGAVKAIASSDAVALRKQALGYLSKGGMVPQYFAKGGLSRGSDTVPAMLTPGEYVMSKSATQKFGPLLKQMNESGYPKNALSGYNSGMVQANKNEITRNSNSVYNYSLSIDASGGSMNPNDIARVVLTQIKNMDSQRIRGNKY